MPFDYKKAKVDILNTLNSKVEISNEDAIPDNEQLFNFKNGVKAWVGSIFVDMVDSTTFFTNYKCNDNVIARIMRSFVEQIVSIMNDNEYLYDIGIRGDCVFGIFQAKKKKMLIEMFDTACLINTFIKMFNRLLSNKGYPTIKVGIGIGSSEELIIKVGKKRIVNDKIWIGDAVVNASNLSDIANRDSFEAICMDKTTYGRIISSLIKTNEKYKEWIKEAKSDYYPDAFYQCNLVMMDFNKWINGGMK